MIARLLRIVAAAAVTAIVAALVLAWWDGWPPSAIAALALGPVGCLSLFYAAEGAWLLRHADRDPATPRPAPTRVAIALAEELARGLLVFLWHQPRAGGAGIEHLHPARHTGRCGVLLVHGYFCNAGFWWAWSRRFRNRDTPHLAVTLEPAFGAIDDMVPALDAAVRRLHAVTEAPVVVVAHSMGGLVVRAWWRRHAPWADAHIHRVVTIGTPHHGTPLASLASTANGRQMRVDSPWLRELAASEPTVRATRFLCVHSDCDNVVFPPRQARMKGAASSLVAGAAHIALAARPQVHELVDGAIAAVEARPSD